MSPDAGHGRDLRPSVPGRTMAGMPAAELEPLPNRLFWIHIWKSAGSSARVLLEPHYLQVDRTVNSSCFTGRPRAEWNDILNNFRVPLGAYQHRRCLFARAFLYPEWDDLLRLGFARHPVDRCVSMFHYLYLKPGWGGWAQSLRHSIQRDRRLFLTTRGAFDAFLDLVGRRLSLPADRRLIYPRSLEFTTHTGRMSDEICDERGGLMLNRLYRMECLEPAIRRTLDELGLAPVATPRDGSVRRNARSSKVRTYRPTPAQRAVIERLYAKDLELYETAMQA
jgi:hypothetical protein